MLINAFGKNYIKTSEIVWMVNLSSVRLSVNQITSNNEYNRIQSTIELILSFRYFDVNMHYIVKQITEQK